MLVSEIRELLNLPDGCAYFQTGGFSPKPQPVIEEVIKYLKLQSQGPAIDWIHEQMMEMYEDVRAKVAQALNADSDEIMLTENTTIGLNIIASGIDWQPGDNVILSTHEHPGNRIPWYSLVKRYGIELRFLTVQNNEQALLTEFESLLDNRTQIVSLSHVSRRTGLRLPAKRIVELAHKHNVPVLLDGAQSFGAIPVDVRDLNCDFYAFSGHKYILGPQATGGFYVRKDRLEWIKPSWIGSHSQQEMDMLGHLVLHNTAKRFEFGTRNLADQAGFGKALDLLQAIGWENVHATLETYTGKMKSALQSIPNLVLETPLLFDQSSGNIAFHIPGLLANEIYQALWMQHHVLVSTLEGNDHSIRISTHIFNNAKDCDQLVEGLRDVVNKANK